MRRKTLVPLLVSRSKLRLHGRTVHDFGCMGWQYPLSHVSASWGFSLVSLSQFHCRCIQVIAYRDIFKPEEAFQQEVLEPWQEYPFKLKTKYIGPSHGFVTSATRFLNKFISANDSVKLLLEGSIEHIDNVFAKAADLSYRLQQIDDYLENNEYANTAH